MLIWEIERASVVPRLSDLEPDGRRSWPWVGFSRPPWFALGVAVESSPGLVGKGVTWGGFDECRRRGRAINNSPAEKALGPSQKS